MPVDFSFAVKVFAALFAIMNPIANVLTLALFAAPSLGRHLSPKVTAITKRLMGMILAAIAMQMIVTSLQVFFPAMAGAAGHA